MALCLIVRVKVLAIREVLTDRMTTMLLEELIHMELHFC